MSDDRSPDRGPDPDEVDLGAPISELFDLQIETGDEFLRGVRRRIERREMAATAVDLSLVTPGQVLWSYVEMFLTILFGSQRGSKDRKDS